MRKLVLLVCISLLACKKDASENITAYNWVLETAVISPAKTYNGKQETNYMLMDPSTCLQNSFTITFSADGTYGYSSTGPLCDLIANDKSLKWTKEEDKITLSNNNAAIIANIIQKDKLVYENNFTDNNLGVNYKVIYTFKAKSK